MLWLAVLITSSILCQCLHVETARTFAVEVGATRHDFKC